MTRTAENNSNWKGGKPKCIDCGIQTSNYGVKRCSKCSKSFRRGSNSPNYKHGKTTVEVFCLDCNIKLNKKALIDCSYRCKSCTIKLKYKLNPELIPNYIDGSSGMESFCIDCNKKLNIHALYDGTLRCKSCSLKEKYKNGFLNPFWKGGITPLHQLIRTCTKYKEWRFSIFKRDKFTCQECQKIGSGDINVDHIVQFSDILDVFLKKHSQYDPISDKEALLKLAIKYKPFWDLTNGRTLCIPCHKLVTKSQRTKIVLSNTHLLN